MTRSGGADTPTNDAKEQTPKTDPLPSSAAAPRLREAKTKAPWPYTGTVTADSARTTGSRDSIIQKAVQEMKKAKSGS